MADTTDTPGTPNTTAAPDQASSVTTSPYAPDTLSALIRDNITTAGTATTPPVIAGGLAAGLTQAATAATAAQQMLASAAATDKMLTAMGITVANQGAATAKAGGDAAGRVAYARGQGEYQEKQANVSDSKALGMDLSDPLSLLSKQTARRNAASDAYDTDLSNYLRKKGMSLLGVFTGENSFGDLMDARFLHPKEDDLAAAQVHLNQEKDAEGMITATQNEFTGQVYKNHAVAATMNGGTAADMAVAAATNDYMTANRAQQDAVSVGFRGMEAVAQMSKSQYDIVHSTVALNAQVTLDQAKISLQQQELQISKARMAKLDASSLSAEQELAFVQRGAAAVGKNNPAEFNSAKIAALKSTPQGKAVLDNLMNAAMSASDSDANPLAPTPYFPNYGVAAITEDGVNSRVLSKIPGAQPLQNKLAELRATAFTPQNGKPVTAQVGYQNVALSAQKFADEHGGDLDSPIFGGSKLSAILSTTMMKDPTLAPWVKSIIAPLIPTGNTITPTGVVLNAISNSNISIPQKVELARTYMNTSALVNKATVQEYKVGIVRPVVPYAWAPTSGGVFGPGRAKLTNDPKELINYFTDESRIKEFNKAITPALSNPVSSQIGK